ncbi:MAG: calcium/sodium antiporter [Pirellulaceae bacterium]|nr:calcium/sodium antiporter [Pirellulaceae bacterium]
MVESLLLVLVGLVVLVTGGELLVRGAARLAALARISPLLIGLTIVAFGTSAPELAVSMRATWFGQSDVAIGNVVGSNIANILMILGLSACVAPLVVSSQLVRFDVPLMALASVAVWILGSDGQLTRWDGAILFGTLLIYVVWSIRASRREVPEVQDEFAKHYVAPPRAGTRDYLLQGGLLLVGLCLLTLGSSWLVDGAVQLATLFGVSQLIIGLTIVAVGTSLPELVTSIIATMRGQRDIAVGNIVGSNLFNILCVVGLTATIVPAGLEISPQAIRFDLPIMIAVAVACLPVFFTGHRIDRWEGAVFFGYYLVYLTYQVVAATNPTVPLAFTVLVFGFALPLTAITLIVSVVHALQQRSGA